MITVPAIRCSAWPNRDALTTGGVEVQPRRSFLRITWYVFTALPLLTVALAASSQVVRAQSNLADFGAGSHERWLELVARARSVEYSSVISRVDAHLAVEPQDVVAAIEKCRFIVGWAEAEDAPIESASADSDKCREALDAAPYTDDPEVRLYLLDELWGDDGIAAGRKLLTPAESWPDLAQARLHEKLAALYEFQEDSQEAGKHAAKAVALNPGSTAVVIAAERLMIVGAKERARTILLDAPPETWAKVRPVRAAEILIDLGEAAAAAKILQAADIGAWDTQSQILLAKALAASGRVDAARKFYANALGADAVGVSLPLQRGAFEFEREFGTAEQAATAYRRLRNQGYDADPYGYYRLSLLLRHPTAPWSWVDLLGPIAMLASIAFCVLLPGVLVVPVHYLSLAKRLAGWAAPPAAFPCWTLRHLWYVLAVLLGTGILATYIWAHPEFESMFSLNTYAAPVVISDTALGTAMLVTTVVSALLCFPPLVGVDLSRLLLGRWTWIKSVSAGIGLLIAARLALAAFSGVETSISPGEIFGTDVARAMRGIYFSYGTAVLYIVAAVAVPVIEEFFFRGVMLNSLSRYMPFLLAAGIQASLFGLFHEDWKLLPFYIAFGFCGAWLYRVSQGLLAPIAMHVANNLVAVTGLVAVARAMNSST